MNLTLRSHDWLSQHLSPDIWHIVAKHGALAVKYTVQDCLLVHVKGVIQTLAMWGVNQAFVLEGDVTGKLAYHTVIGQTLPVRELKGACKEKQTVTGLGALQC